MSKKQNSRQNKNFNRTGFKNTYGYQYYLNRLVELAMTMFKWEGLPETIDVRFLELTLLRNGACVFFKDETLGYLALPVAFGGKLNLYEIPTMRRAYAVNGYSNNLTEENSVLIYNNYIHTATLPDLKMFADILYEYDRIISVNTGAQKTPCLITCDESQRVTMLNMYMQYEGNSPVIYGTKSINPDSIKAISTGAPYISDKIYQLKTQYWNEALTTLGISNVNIVKKERLVSDEVTRNLGGVIASRYSRLESRENACKMINKMFPELNVKCVYREDYSDILVDVPTPNPDEEGENDE